MYLSYIQNLIYAFAPLVENLTPHTTPLFPLFPLFYKQINSCRRNKYRQLNLKVVRKSEFTNLD